MSICCASYRRWMRRTCTKLNLHNASAQAVKALWDRCQHLGVLYLTKSTQKLQKEKAAVSPRWSPVFCFPTVWQSSFWNSESEAVKSGFRPGLDADPACLWARATQQLIAWHKGTTWHNRSTCQVTKWHVVLTRFDMVKRLLQWFKLFNYGLNMVWKLSHVTGIHSFKNWIWRLKRTRYMYAVVCILHIIYPFVSSRLSLLLWIKCSGYIM